MSDFTQKVLESLRKQTAETAQKLKSEGLLPTDETKYDENSSGNDMQRNEGGVEGSETLPE